MSGWSSRDASDRALGLHRALRTCYQRQAIPFLIALESPGLRHAASGDSLFRGFPLAVDALVGRF